MARKNRICAVNGDRPGVKNRSISFTDAEHSVLSAAADKKGITLSMHIVNKMFRNESKS